MSAKIFAAVDLGAESGRVVAGHFDGSTLRLEEIHRFPNLPANAGGTMQWDVLRLWNEITDGLTKLGSGGAELAGIGVDTWGVDFGLLDGNDQLLGNPVHYRDKRNDGQMEYAATIVPREEIYEHTGLQFLPFNSLFQLLALKRQNSPQLEVAKTLLFVPDLLHFWLTGNKYSEYTIASTSQMLDAGARAWDKPLLERFGLPTDILQQLRPPGSELGKLRADVAGRTGLSAATPVIAPGCHDTASAVAAVPFEKGSRAAYLSSGTWSLMGLELAEPRITPDSYRLGFTNEGGASNTIRFLKNIAGLWLVQGCRRSFARQGKDFSYAQLTQMAASAHSGPFVEPDAANFAAPDDMATAIRDYCAASGQGVPQTEGELVRCCLDSLALKYRWTLEKLEQLSGQSIPALHIVGGGTQNTLLSQLTADCLGRPVICGPVEATAAGNILLQATSSGELGNLDDIRAVIRNSFPVETFEPRAAEKQAWDDRFGKFEGLSH
jgi:sugar (pentulose or hexulose) kinase